MDFILIFFAMAIPTLTGFAFTRYLLRGAGVTLAETVLFGFGVGTGFLTYEIFLLGLTGVRFSITGLAALPVIFALFFFFLLYRSRVRALPGPVAHIDGREIKFYISIFLALWLAVKIYFVFDENFTRPIHSIDSFLNWSVTAKFFFYRRGLALNPGDEHFFGAGYRFFLGHPLHYPLVQMWTSLWLGKFHEVYAKAPSFFYFSGLLGVLYYAVKRETGAFYAIVTVFFMASAPIFTYHGIDAYADLPLSFYALAGMVTFWRFLRTEDRRFLILSGIFLGMGIFVKNEGVFFAAAVFAALLLFLLLRKKPVAANLACFLAPLILVSAPWLLFKASHGFGYGHSGHGSGLKWLSDPWYSESAGRGVHWEVIPKGLKEIFFSANYNIVFPFWLLLSAAGFKAVIRSELKYLYMVLFLVIGVFFFVYLTFEATAVTEVTGIHRNTLTYLPMVFYTAALLLGSLLRAPPSTEAVSSGE